jgi:NADP-dependent 3-hydroxy acid dehydrogenase YdfG
MAGWSTTAGEVEMTRALVTGCSSGIGRATAVELKRRGYEVVATARDPATLEDLDADLRLRLDVASDDSVAAAIGQAGPVDILVNNAGCGLFGPLEQAPISEVRRMFETNVFGARRMIQAVLPGTRARGAGTIVNVSGVSGRLVFPLGAAYCATKYALESSTSASSRVRVPTGRTNGRCSPIMLTPHCSGRISVATP